MNFEPAADTADVPELIPHAGLTDAVAFLAEGLARNERVLAVTGADPQTVSAAADAIVAAFASARVRLIPVHNTDPGPFSLARLVAGIAATGGDLPTKHGLERACDILSQRGAGEERILLLIENAEALDPDALSFLGIGLSAFGTGHPLLQVLLIGLPELWSVLERPGSFGVAERLKLRLAIDLTAGPLTPPAPGAGDGMTTEPEPAREPVTDATTRQAELEWARRRAVIDRAATAAADIPFPFIAPAPSGSRHLLAITAGSLGAVVIAFLLVAVFYRDMPWANWAASPQVESPSIGSAPPNPTLADAAPAPVGQPAPVAQPASVAQLASVAQPASMAQPASVAQPASPAPLPDSTPRAATLSARSGIVANEPSTPPPAAAPPLTQAAAPAPFGPSDQLKADFEDYIRATQPKAASLSGPAREALFREFLAWRARADAFPHLALPHREASPPVLPRPPRHPVSRASGSSSSI